MLKSLLSADSYDNTNKTGDNKAAVLFFFSIAGVVMLGLFGVISFFNEDYILAAAKAAAMMVLLINIIITYNTRKWQKQAYSGSVIIGLLFIYMYITVIPGGMLWILSYPVFTILLMGLLPGIIFSGILVVLIASFHLLPSGSPFYVSFKTDLSFYFFGAYLFIFSVCLFYEYLRNRATQLHQTKIADSENANKIKEEFISQLSHQIRTPLNNIMVVGNILENSQLDNQQKDMINTIIASANNLVNVVNNIGKITAVEISEKKSERISFDLFSTINSIILLFKNDLSENASINLTFSDQLSSNLIGDPVRIKQIFLNLIETLVSNKKKDKINVSIQVSTVTESKTAIVLEFRLRSDNLIYCGEENGTEKYYFKSGNAANGKEYLDLSIARKLIESVDSKLDFYSDNEHSEFLFVLSLKKDQASTIKTQTDGRADEQSRPAPKSYKPLVVIDLKNANILLVEDNIVNQKIVNLSLKKQVRNIDIANNGKEALDKFGNTKYDLILMDIQMPVMDGITATKKIREIEQSTNSHTPIIAITANALAGDREYCLAAGMNEYISKPFQIEDLIDKMKKLLTGQD